MPGSLIRRTVGTARAVRAVVARPPYATPGAFYSPLTTNDDVARCMSWADVPSVDLREEEQLAMASRLGPILAEPPPGPRYKAANDMYGPGDAAVFRAMLAQFRPRRLIEVGSGYSTALALDEAEHNGDLSGLEITCIEPYPERLLELLVGNDRERITLLRQPVQELPLTTYERLRPGDVLFIDSTHVVKAGSDVVWLFLHVLPVLAPGVVVHIHDVFWPFEYPDTWLRQHRDWTEAYLAHAFLIGNSQWQIEFFSSWFWRCHPELVPGSVNGKDPGSIWIRKVG
jgi:predicted O-methyltransferase YrrM